MRMFVFYMLRLSILTTSKRLTDINRTWLICCYRLYDYGSIWGRINSTDIKCRILKCCPKYMNRVFCITIENNYTGNARKLYLTHWYWRTTNDYLEGLMERIRGDCRWLVYLFTLMEKNECREGSEYFHLRLTVYKSTKRLRCVINFKVQDVLPVNGEGNLCCYWNRDACTHKTHVTVPFTQRFLKKFLSMRFLNKSFAGKLFLVFLFTVCVLFIPS